MKRIISFFIISISLSLTLLAQQKDVVQFDKTTHDFGDFSLDSGEQTCTFTLTNTGNRPLVIQSVLSSCGCTTPQWTKEPIEPGKTGTITAIFLNNQGPYPFNKTLSVYVSGVGTPYVLHVRGVVHRKAFTIKETHPVLMGDLRLRTKDLELGQIKQGQSKTDSVEVVNVSKLPLFLSFTHHNPSIAIEAHPKRLNANEKGYIVYTYNTTAQETWGNVVEPILLVQNQKSDPTHALVLKTSVKMNTAGLTKAQKESAPLPVVDKSSYDFGKLAASTPLATTFTLSNKGKEPLILYKADVSHPGIEVTYPPTIAPGKEAVIGVSLPAPTETGEVIYSVSFTTNAPSRPTINLLLYGELN